MPGAFGRDISCHRYAATEQRIRVSDTHTLAQARLPRSSRDPSAGECSPCSCHEIAGAGSLQHMHSIACMRRAAHRTFGVQLTEVAHAQFFGVSGGGGGGAGSWAARLPVECVRLRQQKSAYCTLPGEPFDQVKSFRHCRISQCDTLQSAFGSAWCTGRRRMAQRADAEWRRGVCGCRPRAGAR